jgi:citrate lyase subunit beta/citryl-CoA lyase
MSLSIEQLEACRSLLFVPANEQRFISKAHQRGAGAIILDLEDAISPDQKETARGNVRAAAAELRRNGVPHVLVRINAGSADDIEAAVSPDVDALVLPKVEVLDDLVWADKVLAAAEQRSGMRGGHVRLVVLVETPAAVLNAASLAAHERVAALVLGSEDLALALGVEPTPEALTYAASAIVFAARGHQKVPLGVPGSLASIVDIGRFAQAVQHAQQLGMAGTVCIHPNQVDVVSAAFAATPEAYAQAQRILAAFDAAQRAGRGAVMFEGKMLDLPIVERARRIVAHCRQNDENGSSAPEGVSNESLI